jgi:hypothetical protein
VKKLNAAVLEQNGGSGSSGVVSAAIGAVSGSGGLQYECLDCAMAFYSAAQLKRHMQFAHGCEEQLFCQVSTSI